MRTRIRCRYVIERANHRQIVLRDVGHADGAVSITNDAENLVARLAELNLLPPGRRLYYYDSDGQIDQIVVRDGKFVEFELGGPAAEAE